MFSAAGDGLVQELNEIGIETFGGFQWTKDHMNDSLDEAATADVPKDIKGVVTGEFYYHREILIESV